MWRAEKASLREVYVSMRYAFEKNTLGLVRKRMEGKWKQMQTDQLGGSISYSGGR